MAKKGMIRKVIAWIMIVLGSLIVYATHFMIFASKLSENLQNAHAVFNLFGITIVLIGGLMIIIPLMRK